MNVYSADFSFMKFGTLLFYILVIFYFYISLFFIVTHDTYPHLHPLTSNHIPSSYTLIEHWTAVLVPTSAGPTLRV